MKKLNLKWHKNIGHCDRVAFKVHDYKLIKKMFDISLKYFLKEKLKSDWIELECRWRNTGYKKYEKK